MLVNAIESVIARLLVVKIEGTVLLARTVQWGKRTKEEIRNKEVIAPTTTEDGMKAGM